MKARQIVDGIYWMGSVDWDRRLFDSLIPLPDGTSYNAYLVRGSRATALLDAVDPAKTHELMEQLADIERIDYIIAHHAEQDHSGALPDVLDRFPDAEVVCTPKCGQMLCELLPVPPNRIKTVADGDTLDLGGRTLRFVHAPWVHWPETMFTYAEEDGILFSCDFLGSHIASSELTALGTADDLAAAKRYYAEIMMPFAVHVVKHLDRLEGLNIRMVCPSHGKVWADPTVITSAYRQWSSGRLANKVCLPFVSMHGSTEVMVDALVDGLIRRRVEVERFELTGTDLGRIAMSLVDSATIVMATPTVLGGVHPVLASVAFVANALRPRAQFVSVMTSYGWAGRAVEQLAALTGNLKAKLIEPVTVKGFPGPRDLETIDGLAEKIAQAHAEAGLSE
jgi:flavorubredoxin